MDLNEMLKEAQKLQQDMENIQKQLETEESLIANSSGSIRIKVTGSGKFTSLSIDDQFLKNNPREIEKELLSTIQKAVEEARKKHEEAMKKITASLSLPGLDELKEGIDLKGPSRRASSSGDYQLNV